MTYHVDAERISIGKRIARVMVALVFYALATSIIHLLWSKGRPTNGTSEDVIDGVIFVGIAFFVDSIRCGYDLEADDDVIRIRGALGDRQVRRGHVRYLREQGESLLRERGFWLSERRGTRRFFSGYVFVPASLPDYDKIKAKAMSWMEIG